MPLLAQADTNECRNVCQPRITFHSLFANTRVKWSCASFVVTGVTTPGPRVRIVAVLSAEVLAQRLAALPAFVPTIQSKWLRRYSHFVTSADSGAVLQD